MTRFITSIRVEQKPGAPHAHVTVWIHGANCGTLCVRQEEAEPLRRLLEPRHGAMLPPPADWEDETE
jgi:hypothetical protein